MIDSIARRQSDQLLQGLLEHRDPETVLWFLRTLAATVALPSDPDPASSKSASLYLELLDQIDPAYARYFSKQYSRACKSLRLQKSPKQSGREAHTLPASSSHSLNSAPGIMINRMKSEPSKPKEPEVAEHGNAAKPISFHPLTVDAAVFRLLQVKPEPKPEK